MRRPSTFTANSPMPGTCGSRCGRIGISYCSTTCKRIGLAFTPRTYEQINDRLFVNAGRNDNIHDTPSKAWWWSHAHLEWLGQQQFMAQYIDAQVEPVRLTMQTIYLLNMKQTLWKNNQRSRHTKVLLEGNLSDGKQSKVSISLKTLRKWTRLRQLLKRPLMRKCFRMCER